MTLDVDATSVTAHSDKEDPVPSCKHGFGFHPMLVFLDETEEALAGMLRPGNAGANDAADHVVVLERALAQLPPGWQLGHAEGDDASSVLHPILVRSHPAGATYSFVEACRERNLEVSIGMPVDRRIRDALMLVQEEDWVPVADAGGQASHGAWATELTGLVDLSAWGGNARLICRRERPHPGAQLSLSDASDGFRHQCFLTTSAGDVATLELRHRGHARVEDRIGSPSPWGS